MQDQHALQSGSILDRYKIIRVLGEGGFGITYLAEDIQLGLKVVIKEYFPNEFVMRSGDSTITAKSKSLGDFAKGMQRFKEEAKTLAKFNHPSIVKILGYFEANDTAYFVMEYEEGIDLSHYLKQQNRALSQEEILSIMMPILEGLKEVHKYKYLHRDIKPGNILLRSNKSPVLIDFGASKLAIGEASRSITSMLTEGYAPLEQYSTDIKQQGPFTDIYAVAAVIYKMITGEVPPSAQTRSYALLSGSNDPYKSLTTLKLSKYDNGFLKAVNRALDINANKRPQNVQEFQADLAGKEKVTRVLPDYVLKDIDSKKNNNQIIFIFLLLLLVIGGGILATLLLNKPFDPKSITTKISQPDVKVKKENLEKNKMEEDQKKLEDIKKEKENIKQKIQKDQLAKEDTRQEKEIKVMDKENEYIKYITIINDKVWQDEQYTENERKAYINNKNNGKVMNFKKAVEYCENLSLAGADNWRLPSIEDLRGLYKYKSKFENIAPYKYWSSTDVSNLGTTVFSYDLNVDSLESFYWGNNYYVKCVHDNTFNNNNVDHETTSTENTNKDVPTYTKACNNGDAGACDKLGVIYQYGFGVERDYSKAEEFFTIACDGGYAGACYILGQWSEIKQNYLKSKKYYTRSCNKSYVSACFNLGILYVNGLGVKKDYDKAIQLFNKACEGGEIDACVNLGALYIAGQVVQVNSLRAKKLFNKACNENNAMGCANLGLMYKDGEGIKQNYTKALKFFMKACDSGNADSCYNAGLLYDNGFGVKEDDIKAKEFYRMSCDKGHEDGCDAYLHLYKYIEV